MKRTLIVALSFVGVLSILCSSARAQSESREEVLKQIEAKNLELRQLEKQLLVPAEEDLTAFADFLAQPDTGLVRLLPREIYDNAVKHPEKHLAINGGGSYYSFTRRTHEYGWGTQIGLEQGNLKSCFSGADYGILSNLGDVPIESINPELSAVKFLTAYERAPDEPTARSEYLRFAYGLEIAGTSYKTHLPARVNNSYILRGIHFSDSDILVAFRVVRKDTDGSLIVLWKLLKTYPKPEFAKTIQAAN